MPLPTDQIFRQIVRSASQLQGEKDVGKISRLNSALLVLGSAMTLSATDEPKAKRLVTLARTVSRSSSD